MMFYVFTPVITWLSVVRTHWPCTLREPMDSLLRHHPWQVVRILPHERSKLRDGGCYLLLALDTLGTLKPPWHHHTTKRVID